jgi:spermidine/putrescine transport system permease protein
MREVKSQLWLSLPSLLWMLCFFAGPALLLFMAAFRSVDAFGHMGSVSTLEHWQILADASVQRALLRTAGLSLCAVAGCLLIALPVAWSLRLLPERVRLWWLVVLMTPFLTSVLVRVYSWRVLLQEEGWVAGALRALHLLPEGTSLLYNQAVVVLVMIYSYLPLAILPVYAALSRFDMELFHAARDLGAGKMQAFVRVVLPGIHRGVAAAALSVGVPCLGAYAIPEMLGGMGAEMLGSKMAHKLFADRNLPQAAVMASALAIMALPLVYWALNRTASEKGDRA